VRLCDSGTRAVYTVFAICSLIHASTSVSSQLRKEVTQASNVELLTAILGNRVTAEVLLKKAGGSLFALLHGLPHGNGDLFCAYPARAESIGMTAA
jgi:hypothetical protein